jgi:hypothetical protein
MGDEPATPSAKRDLASGSPADACLQPGHFLDFFSQLYRPLRGLSCLRLLLWVAYVSGQQLPPKLVMMLLIRLNDVPI